MAAAPAERSEAAQAEIAGPSWWWSRRSSITIRGVTRYEAHSPASDKAAPATPSST